METILKKDIVMDISKASRENNKTETFFSKSKSYNMQNMQTYQKRTPSHHEFFVNILLKFQNN